MRVALITALLGAILLWDLGAGAVAILVTLYASLYWANKNEARKNKPY